MDIREWIRQYGLFILMVCLVFLLVFYVSGGFDCWLNGNCPPVSNLTRMLRT